MSNATAAVFPTLGATHARPSRVTPGALSPFASIAAPVPAPQRGEPLRNEVFPTVDRIAFKPKADPHHAPPDPEELARLRAEAAEIGRQEGYGEGLQHGFQDGQTQGYEDGLARGRQEAYEAEIAQRQIVLQEFADALQGKVDGLNGELAGWLQDRETAMADLAMDVVRRLLGHELEASRASALAITKEALAEVSHGTRARIRLNPFDVPVLDQHRSQILAASASLRDIDLVPDSNILGGCLIETEGGVVDATLDTRLVLLEDAWREAA